MDQSEHSERLKETYRLLALCARARGDEAFYKELAERLASFRAWEELPVQAELHGMAPLLWHHCQQGGLALPAETERVLKGLYLRQRAFNRAHAQSLVWINGLFEEAGIRALVLKGLALAYRYYPDPALRPVSDLDLLLKSEDMLHARQLLINAGFESATAWQAGAGKIPKELNLDAPPLAGIRSHVELHHYDPDGRSSIDHGRDDEFKGFEQTPEAFFIEGQAIYAPAPGDTLRYLSRHLARHLFSGKDERPLQLKWTADIVSLVEQDADRLDWEELERQDPALLKRLEVFYSLTPRPEDTGKLPFRPGAAPQGLNQYPNGWPQQVFGEWKTVGAGEFIARTLRPPSDWWLRLYYGIDETRTGWYGQVIYRVNIPRLIFWALVRKLKKA